MKNPFVFKLSRIDVLPTNITLIQIFSAVNNNALFDIHKHFINLQDLFYINNIHILILEFRGPYGQHA